MSYDFLDVLCEIEAVEETSTVFILKDEEVQEFEPAQLIMGLCIVCLMIKFR